MALQVWPKCLAIFGLIAFTLYAARSLIPQSSSRLLHRYRRTVAEDEDCLWVLVAQNEPRTLTSPGYPDNYPSNTDCQWLITSREENRTVDIRIQTLAIEPDRQCRLDYLHVHQGPSAQSPTTLDPLCGRVDDRLVPGNSSSLLLVFHSDSAYEDSGFRIEYFLHPEHKEEGCIKDVTAETRSGWLTSPGFPSTYPDRIDCHTLIRVHDNRSRIQIHFESVDLEYGDNCTFDYIRVMDGYNGSHSELLGVLCHPSDARSFESSSDALLVHFHSDHSVHRKGFRARYSTIDNDRRPPVGNCVWESGDLEGVVTSPNYPENYPSYANCSLWIVAPEGHRMRIQIEALLLEIESNCSYDFLQIAEGEEKVLARLCGRATEPQEFVSEGRELQIRFQSDDFVEFLGFKIKYEFLFSGLEEPQDAVNASEGETDVLRFRSRPVDVKLSRGASHVLHCSTDHPNAKIRWLKGDLFLAGDNPLPGLRVLANDTLWIQSMGRHLAGTYSCVLVSAEGVIKASADVLSTDQEEETPCAMSFRKTPSDSEFEEGDFAVLECLASVPGARVSWTKDGQTLAATTDGEGRVTLLKHGYVLLDAVQPEDSGTYECAAQDPETGCVRKADARIRVREKTPIEDVCGRTKLVSRNTTQRDHAKIIGGHDAQKGAYPWQVMLWEPRRGSFCGATLLNERWIATAAHCLNRGIPVHAIRIRLGKHDRERHEDEEVETSVADSASAVRRHPDFNPRTFDNDLALVRMKNRILFTDHILPVCLGDRELSERLLNGESRMGIVIGWGQLKEKGPTPRYLQEIKVPVVDLEVCRNSTTLAVTRNMFCAGYSQEVIGDSCYGDSGGPFLVRHDDARWYMVGVVSWGEGCGKSEKYGFYTKIANHLSWIRGVIKS